MKTIKDLDIAGKRVFIRCDFNVPVDGDGNITDDRRIRAALPTIRYCIDRDCKIILASHYGRPTGEGFEPEFSLASAIFSRLNTLLKLASSIKMANDVVGKDAQTKVASLEAGEVLLLENLRFHAEEKKGDASFAKKLADLADFYVNDAFGTAHRPHASTAVIAQYFKSNKCFGYIMAKEVANAEKVLQNPQKPFTAIVGGAKVSDKLLILENIMKLADNLLIGGGMAYTFIKAQGGNIGNSLLENDRLDLCLELLEKAKKNNVKIYLPKDSVCGLGFGADVDTKVLNSSEIEDGWMGLDIGPKATKEYAKILLESKTILWNGPMGVFEFESFQNGTKQVAKAVAKSTKNGAFSLIGGGDSAAAIHKFELGNEVSYVSTGGGALLEYFEGKELPGIKAIME